MHGSIGGQPFFENKVISVTRWRVAFADDSTEHNCDREMKALPTNNDDRPLPDPALADLVPQSVAEELRVVPLRFLGGVLVFAGPQRLGPNDIERLAFILNRRVHCTVRSDKWYDRAMTLLYPSERAASSSDGHSVSWYWGGWHYWAGETLVVKASGWEGMEHWTGAAEIPPDHADYDLWRWIVNYPLYHRLIDETEIPAIRRVWRRWQSRGFEKSGPQNQNTAALQEMAVNNRMHVRRSCVRIQVDNHASRPRDP